MSYKTILIIIISIIVVISTWGFLTEWKFIPFSDNYTHPEDIKKEILNRAEKKIVEFPKKFKTVIEDDDEFTETEIEIEIEINKLNINFLDINVKQ